MGAIEVPQLLLLIVILGVPASILVGAVVYVARLARHGSAATLHRARRQRELTSAD